MVWVLLGAAGALLALACANIAGLLMTKAHGPAAQRNGCAGGPWRRARAAGATAHYRKPPARCDRAASALLAASWMLAALSALLTRFASGRTHGADLDARAMVVTIAIMLVADRRVRAVAVASRRARGFSDGAAVRRTARVRRPVVAGRASWSASRWLSRWSCWSAPLSSLMGFARLSNVEDRIRRRERAHRAGVAARGALPGRLARGVFRDRARPAVECAGHRVRRRHCDGSVQAMGLREQRDAGGSRRRRTRERAPSGRLAQRDAGFLQDPPHSTAAGPRVRNQRS